MSLTSSTSGPAYSFRVHFDSPVATSVFGPPSPALAYKVHCGCGFERTFTSEEFARACSEGAEHGKSTGHSPCLDGLYPC